jgi:hypothetical protein
MHRDATSVDDSTALARNTDHAGSRGHSPYSASRPRHATAAMDSSGYAPRARL